MPQDAFTLKYLTTELNGVFQKGKVNRIAVIDNDQVVLTIYTGKGTHKLLISVNAGSPRIGITKTEAPSLLTATNFCMLLRKHLLNATLDKISLVGFDRIVKIEFTASSEFSDNDEKTLYVELMGRYSNIILTENEKVLGGNRGINMFDDGVRPLIVGKKYVFPPTNDKLLPTDVALIDKLKEYDGETSLSKYICGYVQGFAISTMDELVANFTEKYGEFNKEKSRLLYDYLGEFISLPSNPCVLCGEKFDVFAFPYKSLQKENAEDIKYFDTLYGAEEFYFEKKDKEKEFNALKERLNSILQSNVKKSKKRLSTILARIKDADTKEENRIYGELLTANIYKLKGGESEIEVDNYYDGSIIKIKLDKNLSPSKNVENYFKKYNKQKRSLIALNPQKEQAESELNYLLGLVDFVSLAKTKNDLTPILTELTEGGYVKRQQNRNKKEKFLPYVLYEIDGFKVKVGRSNIENEGVTFSGKPNDIWVHTKDYQSSHLLIECENKTVPESVILKCAEICAYRSKARESGKVEVVYCERKFVKKIRNGKIGLVSYTDNKTVIVEPKSWQELIKE